MLKRRILLLSFVVLCFYAACKSDPAYSPATQLAIDDDLIAKYIVKNNIPALKTSQGLYYQIYPAGPVSTDPPIDDNDPVPPPDDRIPSLNDSIKIHYVARLMLSQQVFDSTATNSNELATEFLLKDVIEGWQLGIPLIHQGGHIRLLVPSPLAYQNRQIDTLLKANSILDFDIRLIKVINPSQFKIN
jgi:FKBP-type peptidyl-prolyl cis-trans isomerase FkpA